MFESDNVDAFTMSFYFVMLKNQERYQIGYDPGKEIKIVPPSQKALPPVPTPMPELWY